MLWLKAFHIIFVVCWFAGLFYLPRIFVYYAASEHGATRQQLAVMARRLYRFVTPLMLIAIALLMAVIALLVFYHIQCGRYVNAINAHADQHTHVFYRFFNEVPVLFLFGIVLLAVLKPF